MPSEERVAVISDVHSNLPALEAVLAEADARGLTRILCAGDNVGYYTFPNEVLDIFRERGVEAIAGNHDWAVVSGEMAYSNAAADKAVAWTVEHISGRNMDYVKSLPRRLLFEIAGRPVAVIHGSPYDDDEYVYPYEAHRGMLEAAEADILILGHTHVPFARYYEGEGMIANPGSVGQPRDGDPRTALGILDPVELQFDVVRIPYDPKPTMAGVAEAGLHEFLAQRLLYGR